MHHLMNPAMIVKIGVLPCAGKIEKTACFVNAIAGPDAVQSHTNTEISGIAMKEIDRLVEIMQTLRGPGGCPWDAKQNHKSMVKGLIEEVYELVDAIEDDNAEEMVEELGDVLLHVVFQSIIGKEEERFSLETVADFLSEKLIYRHPHVFGSVDMSGEKEVIVNWERLKRRENGKQDRESILSGIPETLPALLYALKIQSAASRVGFDWDSPDGVVEKIREETGELEAAAREGDAEKLEDEIGDMIFTVVNLARMTGIDPESALRRTNRKFVKRFGAIEKAARKRDVSLSKMPMEEKERVWQETKK